MLSEIIRDFVFAKIKTNNSVPEMLSIHWKINIYIAARPMLYIAENADKNWKNITNLDANLFKFKFQLL